MKKTKKSMALVAVVAVALLATTLFSGLNKPEEVQETAKAWIELKTTKATIEVASTDGDLNRQQALVNNVEVRYTDANGTTGEWFREKEGTFEGTKDAFTFTLDTGFKYSVIVNGADVQVTVSKDTALATVGFKMVVVDTASNKDATVSKPALMVGSNAESEEEMAEIREEAAVSEREQDLGEKGEVVGIQKPENIHQPTQETIKEVTEKVEKDGEIDYVFTEKRPESDPVQEEAPKKEEKPVVETTTPSESETEEPVAEETVEEEVVEETAPEETPKEEVIEETKLNTYERVSILISKGNVLSAFSHNGGNGKLNLIVDSIDGAVYHCHTKDGVSYDVTVHTANIEFNGEVYYF